MSDSVKGAEVEDVLSSVRRLISNDHRRRRPEPEPTSEPAAEAEKLVLSQADRVEETPVETAPSYEEPLAFEEHGDSLEDRIAELEAAISERPEDWEPDGSEDQDQHRPTSMVVSRGVGANRPLRLSRIALVGAEPPKDEDDTTEQPQDNVISEAEHTPDPEDALEEIVASEPLVDAEAEAEVEAEPESSVEADDAAEEEAAEDEPVEEAVAATDDGIEDAEIVEHDPEQLEDDLAERAPKSRTADRMRELYADEIDDQLFDDEALRGLVSALIRDELQGELGERITRNVRKLVRREIQRALAARDLH